MPWPVPVDAVTFDAVATGRFHALLAPRVAFAVGDAVLLHQSAQAPAQLASGAPVLPVQPDAIPASLDRQITAIELTHPALLPGWCLLHLGGIPEAGTVDLSEAVARA